MDERDLAAALEALERFLKALSGEDDLALLQMTTPELHERAGTGPGMCARLREQNEITADECLRLRAFNWAGIVPGEPPAIAFLCKDIGDLEEMTVPTGVGIWARRPVMQLDRGFWRFAGMLIYPGGGWPEGTLQLDIPRPSDPIQ